ncbi:MAG TPA: hypothetical protein DCE71_03725, partial [Parachlamydiales bacterium]|nr:hypothetical protein [Parachlamydiales bacterium]
MNLLNQSIKHHEYSDQYKHQFLPIVGAAASVPTVFISGAKAVTNLFFSAIYIPQCKNKEASECFWAARDLVLVFANNLLNIATLGILNSVLLNAGLLKIDNASPGVSPPANPPFPNPAGVPIQRGGQPLPVTQMPSPTPPKAAPKPAKKPIRTKGDTPTPNPEPKKNP